MDFSSIILQRQLRLQDIRAIIQRYFDNCCSADELSLIHYWYTLLVNQDRQYATACVSLEQRIWDSVTNGI